MLEDISGKIIPNTGSVLRVHTWDKLLAFTIQPTLLISYFIGNNFASKAKKQQRSVRLKRVPNAEVALVLSLPIVVHSYLRHVHGRILAATEVTTSVSLPLVRLSLIYSLASWFLCVYLSFSLWRHYTIYVCERNDFCIVSIENQAWTFFFLNIICFHKRISSLSICSIMEEQKKKD